MPCIHCGSEWIIVTKKMGMKNKTCADCRAIQVEEHTKYHLLQDEAKELIKIKKYDLAIKKLKDSKELRIDSTRFYGKLSMGHYYFTYQFINKLIDMINKNRDNNQKMIKLWDELFESLKIGD